MYERQYEYVLAVAKHGSITAAAEELYITPSALSKAVQKLEEEFGTPFFDRIGKSFSPTYAGTHFLARAKEMVALQQQMRTEMQDIVSLEGGRVRVGLQLNTAPHIVQVVAAFQKKYPKIEVHLIEDTSMRLVKLLENGEIDLMISNADPEINRNFSLTGLSSNEFVLVVPRDHPLVKKAIWVENRKYPVIDISLCSCEKFIIPFSNQRMGAFIENLLVDSGLPINAPIRATTIGTILELVSVGSGITITYDNTVEPSWNRLNLTCLSFDKIPGMRSVVAATCAGRYLSEAAQEFLKLCVEEFRDI